MPASAPDEILAVCNDTSLQGSAFCRALAEATDRWLRELFACALDGSPPASLALVAAGGYGRAELCPGSDVDVVLVDAGRRDRAVLKGLAERIWYPIWDAGVKLGHAVRTPKEALALAATDLDTATAMLDVRLVAGDEEVAADLGRRALAQWQSRSSKWLDALGESVTARHEKAGEVAFLLEPDLKEGRGGLRDVHALGWADAAQRIMIADDHAAISSAYEAILAPRVELQRLTGKPADRLLLQEQDRVAAALGDADADVLMGRLASAARTIAWTSDETWQRIEASLRGPSGRRAAKDQPVGPNLVMREGVIELAPGTDPSTDPGLVLRAAAAAATAGTRLGRGTLDRLAAECPPPPEPWPEGMRRALLRLLGAGADAMPVLEALDQKGVLTRLVPEWARVRSLPQRNAYHRYTVDRHLCEAAAQAAGLAARVHRPDLLLIGAWLHDIGKGSADRGVQATQVGHDVQATQAGHGVPAAQAGHGVQATQAGRGVQATQGRDHSEAGAEAVWSIATRMGFPADEVAVLVTLVRHHLLLADAATRRDIQDPATVEAVAAALGNAGTLELLHALTEADSIATGPSAWSPWKAQLVDDLVARTAKLLAGEAVDEPASDFPGPEHRALIERVRGTGEVEVEGRGPVLALAAPDRPGLFCRVAGTLALNGLDVLAARVWSSEDGMAVEDFRVEPVFGGEPDWASVEADLRRVLAGRLSLEARLAERARVYAGRSKMPSATPARTSVVVDNDASATATVVEVRAPDRIGTLYRITRALADLELDIRHAKVATLGHEVVDSFYVVDANGSKLTDPDHCREVQGAIMVELSRT